MSDESDESESGEKKPRAAERVASAKRLRDRVRSLGRSARVARVSDEGEEEIDPDEIAEGELYTVEAGGERYMVRTSSRASRELGGAAITSAITRAFEATAEQQAALIARLDARLRAAEESEDKLRKRVRELEQELAEARDGEDEGELVGTLAELAQVYVERGTKQEVARWINERLLPTATDADERQALAEIAMRALGATPSVASKKGAPS